MKKSREQHTEVRELFIKTNDPSNLQKGEKKLRFNFEKYIKMAISYYMPCLGVVFSLIYAFVAMKTLTDSDLITKCD